MDILLTLYEGRACRMDEVIIMSRCCLYILSDGEYCHDDKLISVGVKTEQYIISLRMIYLADSFLELTCYFFWPVYAAAGYSSFVDRLFINRGVSRFFLP
ncbi:hypothetical protein [Aeromonas enteropelogenes]|uniref:hypothetical protein n=1 Tax=Aeromonas enteropelogenes TaxID=29489 RepID=UPI003B9DF606